MRLFAPLLLAFLLTAFSQETAAQKTVSAIVKFTGKDTSLTINKGATFLVELFVPNRRGFEWSIVKQAVNCKFLSSQIGEAATMPGAPEQQLWFFKATQKGIDSIRFVYRKPNDSNQQEERLLRVTVQ